MSEASPPPDHAAAVIGQPVHEVHWADALPWWILFRAAGAAFSPTVILLAALGGLATWAGLSIADSLGLAGTAAVDPAMELIIESSPDAIAFPETSSPAVMPSRRALPDASGLLGRLPAPLASVAMVVATPFLPTASLAEAGGSTLRIVWVVLVWAVFGTAITRQVAVKLVGEEQPGFLGAIGFGARKWPSSFNAMAFVLLGVLLLSVPGAVLGLAMRTDWGLALAGFLWPLVLLGSLVLAILVVGLVAGWPLMVAAVGVERGDAFQAISTAFSYLYQRPLHVAFYTTVAAVVFVPALFAAGLFADATTTLAVWATSFGMGHERTAELLGGLSDGLAGGSRQAGVGLRALVFWHRCVETLLGSFGWGYFWSVVTAGYLLLRQAVDGTELDEVVLDELPGEAG